MWYAERQKWSTTQEIGLFTMPSIMKKSCVMVGVVALILFVTPQAFAGGVVGKISTLGVGLEYVMPVNKKISVGVGANAFNYDKSIEESGVDYDAELELKSLSLIADYRPWAGAFRVSGGVLYNGNSLDITAKPTSGSFDFNGVTYTADDIGSVTGEVNFNNVAPYFA